MWTLSGLYFSWTNIDEIHGDFEHQDVKHLPASFDLVSPAVILKQLPVKADSIHQIEVVNILQKPYYSINYFAQDSLIEILADAQTGIIRRPVLKEEAIKIAQLHFAGEPAVKAIDYITTVPGNDEYRGKPLPAWRISFANAAGTNVYVAANSGTVEAFRNNKWRTYDLLWMFHTMDYDGRDNINNWVLRVFSLIGFITVLSGFFLFLISTKLFRKTKLKVLQREDENTRRKKRR
jgi:hypothetical protein